MLLTVNGTTQPLTEWALDYGIPVSLIRSRLRRGWSEERAVTEPMRVKPVQLPGADRPPKRARKPQRFPQGTTITFNGQSLTIRQWATQLGTSYQTIRHRLCAEWPLEEALTVPPAEVPGPRPELIEFRGETLTPKQWAERLGIAADTLRYRLRKPAWTLEAALTEGKMQGGRPPQAA